MKNDIRELRERYIRARRAIRKRLAEFRRKLSAPPCEIFYELCFCLLTPQSKAKLCWASVERLQEKKLLPPHHHVIRASGDRLEDKICSSLSGVRFPHNKAGYVALAIDNHYRDICFSDGNHPVKKLKNASLEKILEYRDYLVKNIKGYGYKEASHFLRNVGLGKDIAILDRHILKNLLRYGAIKKIPPSLTKKNYLEIEDKMRAFSRRLAIPMDELDLLFWSMEAGEIFK